MAVSKCKCPRFGIPVFLGQVKIPNYCLYLGVGSTATSHLARLSTLHRMVVMGASDHAAASAPTISQPSEIITAASGASRRLLLGDLDANACHVSAALFDIARLHQLRNDPKLAGVSAVWPFETGWAAKAKWLPAHVLVLTRALETRCPMKLKTAVRSAPSGSGPLTSIATIFFGGNFVGRSK
jgi:hypothetical protein